MKSTHKEREMSNLTDLVMGLYRKKWIYIQESSILIGYGDYIETIDHPTDFTKRHIFNRMIRYPLFYG